VLERILYEDNHLLVIDKPPGIATQGSRPGERSLLALAKEYVKRKYGKPGNVFLAAVSRLDAAVTGVVVLARTSKAAARLNRQFASREVTKRYLAIVERSSGNAEPPSGRLFDRLLRNDAQRRMTVVREALADRPGREMDAPDQSQRAESIVHVLGHRGVQCLLLVQLVTGRRHQIRVQLSSRGWPIVGDRKYGARTVWSPDAIALHALSLELQHPTRGTRLTFSAAPAPPWDLRAFGTDYSELPSWGENN
jgi:23S rRNA pseudouridine1911/1915/1917 synthase